MVATMASKREYFEEMFEKLSGTLLDLTTWRQMSFSAPSGNLPTRELQVLVSISGRSLRTSSNTVLSMDPARIHIVMILALTMSG